MPRTKEHLLEVMKKYERLYNQALKEYESLLAFEKASANEKLKIEMDTKSPAQKCIFLLDNCHDEMTPYERGFCYDNRYNVKFTDNQLHIINNLWARLANGKGKKL